MGHHAESREPSDTASIFYRAAPGGIRTIQAFSQQKRYKELDLDRALGASAT